MSWQAWLLLLIASWIAGVCLILKVLTRGAARREAGDIDAVFEQMTRPLQHDTRWDDEQETP